MGRPPNPVRVLLRTDAVLERVDRSRHTHRAVAQMLGVSPGYWSALVHRRRALTPDLQARIQACPVFRRAAPGTLWERVERGAP